MLHYSAGKHKLVSLLGALTVEACNDSACVSVVLAPPRLFRLSIQRPAHSTPSVLRPQDDKRKVKHGETHPAGDSVDESATFM